MKITKPLKALEFILAVGAIAFFTALILVVLLQVFARFALPQAPAWTEEVSRILFIYSVACAAPIAIIKNEYVRVDLITNHFHPIIKLILEIIIYLVLCAFFVLIIYHSYFYTIIAGVQRSPAAQIPMYIPFFSMVFVAFMIALFALAKAVEYAITRQLPKDHLLELEEEFEQEEELTLEIEEEV